VEAHVSFIDELITTAHGVLQVQQTMQEDVGHLKEWALEDKFQQRAGACFGRLVRRAHTLTHDELESLTERSVANGHLSAGTWVTPDASRAAEAQQVRQVIARMDGIGRPIVT
jgi:hypothetical protein